jgi:serine/threonine protein kinase
MEFNLSRSNFVIQSNSKLEDKYVKQSKLGEGAYGSVYLSQNKLTSEIRAIKHIYKPSLRYPDRLKKEVSTLMSCDHPHIIKIYEIIEDRKNLYIVMEQCKGGELFDYITKKNKINEKEASMLFRQVMLAVNYLHHNGICHRDLKPENLMFSDEKTLKLIDFGIAKQVELEDTMTTRAGTVVDI